MKRDWLRRRISAYGHRLAACGRWRGWALALGVLSAAPSAAEMVELDDARLARITPGAAPAFVHGPVTSSPSPDDDQSQRPATGVFVANANAVLRSRDEVRLTGDAQSKLSAGTVSNASGADVANGSNVFDRGASGSLFGVDQSNQVTQTAVTTGSLGYFATFGALDESEHQTEESISSSSVLQMHNEHRDRHVVLTSTTRTIDAEVIPDHIGIFDEEVSLGDREIAFPDYKLGFDEFTILLADLPGDKFDVKIVVPGVSLTVTGAKLSAELVIDGPNVILRNPKFTLPELTLTVCCQIGGGSVDIPIPGFSSIPLGDITLENVNPLQDLGFDYGYALLGDGNVTTTSGGIVVDGSIPIDLDALLASMPKPVIPVEIFGVFLFNITLSLPPLNLPTLALDVGFEADFPLPGGFANEEFGGDDCHLVSSASGHCTVTVLRTSQVLHDGYESVTSESLDSFEESHLSVATEVKLGQVTVEGAEAKFTVLRNSELTNASYKVVIVKGNAQSGLSALHTSNAVSSIVANGLNVTRVPVADLEQPGQSRISVTQRNNFVQIGGL